MERTDVLVAGAGIVGLATAWRLARARPDLVVTVLEKEARVGAHQSSRNSGVVHAGVYYEPGSAKARLCRRGRRQLLAYCDRRGVDYALTGKVVVALEEHELGPLADLEERARANGVPGLRRLDAEGIRRVEPAVAGVAGLHSPGTGVIDFAAVCTALRDDLLARGVEVRLETELLGLDEGAERVRATTTRGDLEVDVVVTCAGLQADRVAALSGSRPDVRILPFRGSWLRVGGTAAGLVRGNVYPVPDPSLPFLGVHLTRRLHGELWIGPNAVPAAAREGYDRPAVDWHDLRATLGWPGTWRLAAAHLSTGVREITEDAVRRLYLKRVRRYVPALADADVEQGPSGIRAQAVGRDGRLLDDFEIAGSRRVVHVLNAPSPAATASLAIGEVLAGQCTTRLS